MTDSRTLPAEFSFDNQLAKRLILFLAVLWCMGGFLAGVIGGHPWSYTLRATVALPAIATPLFWLVFRRGFHTSYLISADSIVIRRRGRDVERILFADIKEIRWPLAIILHSGRKIPFYLARPEMERVRDILQNLLPNLVNG